jgi:hypothetical protein
MPANAIWWNRGGPFAFFCCDGRYSVAAPLSRGDCRLDMPWHGVKLQRDNRLRGYWNWPSNELLCCC